MSLQELIVLGVVLVLGLAVGYFVRQTLASKSAQSVEQKVKRSLEEAESKAEGLIAEAKEKSHDLLRTAEKLELEKQEKVSRLEDNLLKREELFNKQLEGFNKEKEGFQVKEKEVEGKKAEAEELKNTLKIKLEEISGLSKEEAKERLFKELRDSYGDELLQTVQKLEHERRDEIEKKSATIITTAIQRYARTHVAELTTSLFHLPNEDFKGKIIGREGRNIRALERATGVEFIVDETPDSIVISCYDPLRREIARMALEKLVKDGRIQPAKIEEKVEEAKQEVQKRMVEIGEAAAFELGIYDLPKEIIQLLGRLHFRTSFGQNVLTHSIEMAYVSGMLAAELGANVTIAKKGALLHDIGKAIDHDVEGTHVELGRKILKKYGIDELIIRAMESHHEEYPFSTPESYIVTAADVLSAARPGARRGTTENYFKRLEDLEKIANSYEGVKTSYAISAGRELRVFVIPEKIDDFAALTMARDIANKIQAELKYPGEIKVNVIREMRAVEYAK